ncbi:hypothetical protein AVEN_67123-1 [Araneus ventricosus]|uniref:RNase H type-1 domain-containing protein n=1 Tax=Araneus ventricosus TaxID=182803 RepID=A0A4Y2KLC5_ARAVE|nr:hypothetical protein AVEN_67123-1 [Araneus ventricosus]
MTVESLSDDREFIWQIKKRLKDREDIKLVWVRAHKGEMVNERADLLAKEASNRDMIDVPFTYSKVQIRNINNKKLTENWQCIWMQSKNGKWTREFLGGRMNWTLPTWVAKPYRPKPCYNLPLSRREMGCGLKVPPTALIPSAISEPYLPSEEANRLKPAILAVKRPGPPRSVVG